MKKLLILIGLVFFSFSQAQAFTDTDSRAIDRLIENGVIQEKNHFFPDLKCTRAQFVVWALKNVGENPEGENISEPFSDITPNDEYAPFIATAWKMGVIPTENTFSPKKPITKIDALAIAMKLEGIKIPLSGVELDYIDAPKNTDEKGIVAEALKMRITQEIQKNIFGTYTTLNRYECAKILDAISLRRTSQVPLEQEEKKKPKQEIFDAVWNTIQTKYLHADEVDPEELMETVIKKTVESLGDQHTVYFNEQEVKDFLTGVGVGTQFGIGAQVGLDKKNRVEIIKPLRNSPAEKAGLQPGDVFLMVNGVDVSKGDMSLEEVVSMIKGDDQTTVHVTFLRRSKEITVDIVRGPIELQAVTPHIVDGYLVLEVDFFGNDTVKDILSAIQENYQLSRNGIILDLRNNPGGFLDSAVDLLSHLLPEGSVAVKTRGRDILHTETVRGPADVADVPLVILVNERSASASEIVSGAVQDYNRGAVVGTTTYGKGTAQELLQFEDGSALKITIAEWLTPKDRSIDGVGITPDYIFEDTEDSDAIWQYAARIIKRGQWGK